VHTSWYYSESQGECGLFTGQQCERIIWFYSPKNAQPKAFFHDRKIQVVEALQDTGRRRFCQSDFLDIDTTLGYPSRFLSGGG
jgi:hypothetical protein